MVVVVLVVAAVVWRQQRRFLLCYEMSGSEDIHFRDFGSQLGALNHGSELRYPSGAPYLVEWVTSCGPS
jgi:hypothetical protein